MKTKNQSLKQAATPFKLFTLLLACTFGVLQGNAQALTGSSLNITGTTGITLDGGPFLLYTPNRQAMTFIMSNNPTEVFGLGFQYGTFYSRSQNNFAWFKGGEYSSFTNDPGGGNVLMVLNENGLGLGLGSGQTAMPAAKLHVNGTAIITGNTTLGGSVSFGNRTGQLLNLFSTQYGTGIQNNTLYNRSLTNFAWYTGGIHSDAELNAGGGVASMVLRNGNLGIGTISPTARLHVASDTRIDGVLHVLGPNFRLENAFSMGGAQNFGIDAPGITNGRFLVAANGNVGIGTAAPAAKLDVNGQIKISGGAPGAGKVLTSDAAGLATWATLPTGTSQWNTAGTAINYVAGNVGIGTAAPSSALQVMGANAAITVGESTGTSGSVFFGNAAHGVRRNYNGQANDVGLFTTAGNLRFSANGPTLSQMTLSSTGNVGIGTDAPTARLDVNGQIKISGGAPGAGKVLTSDAAGLATWATLPTATSQWNTAGTAINYVAGNVGIGTAAPTARLHVAGGNAIIGGALNVTGNTDLGGSVNFGNRVGQFINLHATRYGTGVQSGTLYNRSDANFAWYTGGVHNDATFNAGGGTAVMVLTSGNLGIGTIAPAAKLDVNGQIKISGGAPGAGKVLTSDAAGLATWATLPTATSQWNTAGTAINYVAGNVGIGTAAPTARLDVNGQIKISGGAPGAGKVLTSDAAGLATWATLPTATSQWNTAGTAINYVGGNVGIGTAAPTARLHVAGNTLMGGNLDITGNVGLSGTIFYGNRHMPMIGSYGEGHSFGSQAYTTYARSPKNFAWYRGGVFNASELNPGGGVLDMVLVNGNLGIGAIAPTARLDVNGQIKISGGAPGAGKVLTSDSAGLATWAPITSSQWNTSGTHINYVDGNVGIGTATPTGKLHVVGGTTIIAGALNVSSRVDFGGSLHFGNSVGQHINLFGTLYGTGIQAGTLYNRSNSHFAWYTGGVHNDGELNAGGGTLSMVLRNNNLGIGTAAPTARLHVAGGNAIIGGALNVTGNTDLGGSVNFGDRVGQLINLNTTRYGAGVQSRTLYNRSDANFAWYTGGVHNDGELNAGGGTAAMVLRGGNLGIGTNIPTAKLEVNGQVRILGGSPGLGKVLTSDAAGLATWTTLSIPAASQWNTSGTAINYVAGNVGIGTATPNAALQLGNAAGNRRLVLWENANNDHQYYGFGINSGILRMQADNFTLNKGTSATTSIELMRITGTGNVGIGTAAPTARLHVAGGNAIIGGALNVTGNTDLGGSVNFGNRVGQFINLHATRYGTGVQSGTLYNRSDANFAWYTGGVHNDGELNAGGGTAAMVLRGGNLGIGTNIPTAKLEVNGQVRILGGSPGLGKVLTSDAAGLATWTPITSSQWNTSGTAINYVAGNVGIGTSAPTARLDVKGGLAKFDSISVANSIVTNKIFINGVEYVNVDYEDKSIDESENDEVANYVSRSSHTLVALNSRSVSSGSAYPEYISEKIIEGMLIDEGAPKKSAVTYLGSYSALEKYKNSLDGRPIDPVVAKRIVAISGLNVVDPAAFASLKAHTNSRFNSYSGLSLRPTPGYLGAGSMVFQVLADGGRLQTESPDIYADLPSNGTGVYGRQRNLNFFVENFGYAGSNTNAAYFRGFKGRPHVFGNGMLLGNTLASKFVEGTTLTVDGRVYISEHGGEEKGFTDLASNNYKDYLLWVEEGIVSKDFAIAETEDWPDYVFNKNYKALTLSEIEHAIKTKGHLPTLPSAKEVEKNGYSIDDMTKRLVRTIEELTLHSIEQEKQIVKLKEDAIKQEQQQKLIEQLLQRVNQLESKSSKNSKK